MDSKLNLNLPVLPVLRRTSLRSCLPASIVGAPDRNQERDWISRLASGYMPGMPLIRNAVVGSAVMWLARKALDKKRERDRHRKRLDQRSTATH